MKRTASIVGGLVAMVALILAAPRALGGGLPTNLQAALLKKIIAYDTSLEGKAVKVLVVGDSSEAGSLTRALELLGLSASQVAPAKLPKTADPGTVVFVASSTEAPAGLADLCVGSRLLSVAPGAALAEAGTVSVGLGEKSDGRPEIVIHRSRCHQEGHVFRASLLALARLMGGP
ncbi:MAG: DUF4154 domain-containing protein [Deltaproteobacteria bacterium]|nr:DUF4154 domain-containing protein [Deltaproteobacteria bacterium]